MLSLSLLWDVGCDRGKEDSEGSHTSLPWDITNYWVPPKHKRLGKCKELEIFLEQNKLLPEAWS